MRRGDFALFESTRRLIYLKSQTALSVAFRRTLVDIATAARHAPASTPKVEGSGTAASAVRPITLSPIFVISPVTVSTVVESF